MIGRFAAATHLTYRRSSVGRQILVCGGVIQTNRILARPAGTRPPAAAPRTRAGTRIVADREREPPHGGEDRKRVALGTRLSGCVYLRGLCYIKKKGIISCAYTQVQ